MTPKKPTEHQAQPSTAAPDLGSERGRLAFNKVLNARLPTKRIIAQGLLRTDGDRVLLCELTYKQAWDLPGGVVDPGESPAECVAREIAEELGIEVSVGGLLAVNWLPPYRGWDDALLCLFDLGRVPEALVQEMTFEPREIRSVHWADPETITANVAPYTAQMISEVHTIQSGQVAYLENSARRAG